MRLIDADELVKRRCSRRNERFKDIDDHYVESCDECVKDGCCCCEIDAYEVWSAPTVDAVEVVRCKECKFAVMTTDGQLKYCKERDPHCTDKLYYSDDDFCSRGERK